MSGEILEKAKNQKWLKCQVLVIGEKEMPFVDMGGDQQKVDFEVGAQNQKFSFLPAGLGYLLESGWI